MKTNFFAYCALFFLLIGTVSAQDYAFKVLSSKGHNIAGGASLKVGSKLTANQTLDVGEDSYLVLACSNGKTLEITKKGSYKVQDLSTQANSSGSLASNYAKFVIDELTEAGSEGIAAKNRFQHMNKTGSVKRALGSVATMLPSERSKIYGSNLVLKWYVKDNVAFQDQIDRYRVQIFNLNDEVLYTNEFKQEQATIDLASNPKLMKESVLVCKVIPLSKDNKELENAATVDGDAIVRLEEGESKQISVELGAVTKDNQTALGKLIEARFFEDKELYADAIHAYEEAIKISGGTEQFKKVYQFFLERNGFTKDTNEKK
ncbi:MAG: hypothetical protein EAZ08_10840 [Cytophagales bacterium]|nr:MAG: hypothetical protein EAZ08_10840 [Cytophagales bacterium]